MCNENERNKEKRHARKSIVDGRKHFIGPLHKTGEDDWYKLRDNDSGHNEGTYHLFSKQVNECQEDGFSSVGTRTGAI